MANDEAVRFKAMELGGFEPSTSWVGFKASVSKVWSYKLLICRWKAVCAPYPSESGRTFGDIHADM